MTKTTEVSFYDSYLLRDYLKNYCVIPETLYGKYKESNNDIKNAYLINKTPSTIIYQGDSFIVEEVSDIDSSFSIEDSNQVYKYIEEENHLVSILISKNLFK